MATPSNGFEVIFTQKFGDLEKQLKVNVFFTNETDFFEKRDESFLEIKENLGLMVTFSSDRADAQFFMDGLDMIPDRRLEWDSGLGEAYLSPSEQPVTLFTHTNDYDPLIPGFYRMMVVYQNQSFYSWLKVLPKQLEEAQWEVMKQEVEQELHGLARDLMLKKTGLNTRMQGVSQELLEQFFVINNRFSSVMSALSDLYRKVNYQIYKDYVLLPREKSRMVDEKTIRHAASHPVHQQSFKTPVSAVTYDLPENRLAKKIIHSISNTLTYFIEAVEVTACGLNHSNASSLFRTREDRSITLTELQKLSEIAGKMRGAIQWIKTAPWYGSVGEYQETTIPYVMNSDPRYRAIYQLYRELNNENLQPTIHKSYSYQWKRSDKLYEIWGYIQFIKSLTGAELGFIPESGWIYSQDFIADQVFVPALPSNTEVVFRKENLRIHLVYEALLPTQSIKTSKNNPLYTRGTHTCPDVRLDVYRDDMFIGSIIVDFKYRPRNAIWDENLIFNGKQNEVMRQLIGYGDNIYSTQLYNGTGTVPFLNRLSPIQEVWAIYPNRFGMTRVYDYPDHKVSLIELTPGEDNGHLVDKMKTSVEHLIKTSEYFKKVLVKAGL